MDIGINRDEAQLIYDSIIYAVKMGMRTDIDVYYPNADIPQLLTQLSLVIQSGDRAGLK